MHSSFCILSRAGHDLSDLLSDGSLACPVELQTQIRDHLVGILSGRVHGCTAGSLFRSTAFAQGTVENTTQIFRNDSGKDLFGISFVDGVAVTLALFNGLGLRFLQRL